jgi:putative DNA primase/helicase
MPTEIGAEQGAYDDFPHLRFTPKARRQFTDWREALEHRVRGSDLPEALASHLSKYRGQIPRIALITHLIDEGKGPVGEMSLIKAQLWAEYLEPHAVRLYSAGIQPARAAAKTLLARIRAGHLREKSSFTTRDAYRNGWSGLANQDQAQAAIDVLVAHGWLWEHPYTVGGRDVVEYFVHPKLKP